MKSKLGWTILIIIFLPFCLFAQIENWVYRYNGPANFSDVGTSIVYGADGNIYTAGVTYGNGTEEDFAVISLTAAGDTNWVYSYNGQENSWDRALCIAYGQDNTIYAAGCSYHYFTVISLTTAGDTNWVYRYNSPAYYYDAAHSIVCGADGNIYVAGMSCGIGTYEDVTVISFTPAGDTNWVYRLNRPGFYAESARSIAYGADSNIYVGGYDRETQRDFLVLSLTSAGDTNWVYRYNGPGNAGDYCNSVVYGADGNIYAAGYTEEAGQGDIVVISISASGDTNWVYRYDGPADWDIAAALVYGADDNIYVTGLSYGIGTWRDLIVISLTTAGDTNWVYRYNGPENVDDEAFSIVYGSDNAIYVTGYSDLPYMGSSSLTVISLTTAGDENWVYTCDAGSVSGVGNDIAYGADDNIYIAGQFYDSTTHNDIAVVSLSPDMGAKEEKIVKDENNHDATIINGPLSLPEGDNWKIFDITGRVVVPARIQPGIYFIEIDGKIAQKVVKIR